MVKSSLFDKILLCYESVKDILLHFWKTGKVIDRAKLSETRMIQCNNCTHNTGKTCAICGCFLHVKTRFIAACCPLGKW